MKLFTTPIFALAAAFALLCPGTARAQDSTVVTAQANVLSIAWCEFDSDATLDFGTLDAGAPVDVAASTTMEFRCLGALTIVYGFSDDDGMHETAPGNYRMQHSSGSGYIPYSLSFPTSGSLTKGIFPLWSTWQTLTIDGTILAADYAGAAPGSYTDTVVINISP